MGFVGKRSRRCGIEGCRGLLKAPEFDLRLLTKDKVVRDLENVASKGEGPSNGFYECLRVELRRLAPSPDGRAVLLFCKECGCPVSKIEVLKENTRSARRRNRSVMLD